MIEVVEVKTKKQQRAFVNFPLELYKNHDCYVPFLYGDEMSLFKKTNINYDDCDIVFFLAYKDGKVQGRIAGIEQKSYNAKNKERRCRFSRFDCVNDLEVAKALFDAVENWAKQKNLNVVHGPLGFNDLDREGLLIEGFENIATFEEYYNYDYYQTLIEKCGYGKEIDYLSFLITPPKEKNERIVKLSEAMLKKHKLHFATAKSMGQYLKKYKDGIFDVLDEAYRELYGVVPYTERLRKSIISQFKLLLKLDYIIALVDETETVVAVGIGLPSIAKAVQKCKGKLLPFGFIDILKAKNNTKVFDFALIGIRKKFQGSGITAIILNKIIESAIALGIEKIESNHSLETNDKILNTWKVFEHKNHKRFRCFIKNID
ncbi:MAG: GNAT family N-acetyltransferase [Clostridiales bacterium]|nr:GNAT family N-acetyltransferase [Clostridiales bacterium]